MRVVERFFTKGDRMKRVQVTIEGITPHLQNRFTDEAAQSATDGTRSNHSDRLAPREDAESRLYANEEGNVIVPAPNLLVMLIDAGRFHKIGKSKVSTLKTSLIPAAVTFEETYFLLESEGGWKVDTRPVRIPATGGRILRHRPCFDDWKVTFSLLLDTSVIPAKLFRQIVDDAGIKVGFSDFNPQHRGPFGKFKVIAWVVTEEDQDTEGDVKVAVA